MTNRKIIKIIAFFNLSIIVLYIVNYDISSKALLVVNYFVLFVSLLTLFACMYAKKRYYALENIQISLCVVVMFFLVLEFIGMVTPNLFPVQLRVYLTTEDVKKLRVEMVDHINENPFVKFRPNTIIRTPEFRGTESQFVYEWKTDSLGFKNAKAVLSKGKVDIVTLGDSFTERQGVATDET